jgi:hypothetical protein
LADDVHILGVKDEKSEIHRIGVCDRHGALLRIGQVLPRKVYNRLGGAANACLTQLISGER